jgi:hypothetical protein
MAKEEQITQETLTVAEAGKVAEEFILRMAESKTCRIPQWQGASLVEPVAYYSCEGRPAAYCFSVKRADANSLCGYILVSGDRNHPVILEFSTGLSPDKAMLASAQAVARQYLRDNQSLNAPRLMYASAGSYVAYYPVIEDGKPAGGICISLGDLRVVDPRLVTERGMVEFTDPAYKESLSQEDLKCLKTFPMVDYYLSSHLTSTASFLYHVGPGSNAQGSIESMVDVANHMFRHIPSGIGWDIKGALQQHTIPMGLKAAQVISDKGACYSTIKTQIDNNSPVLVSFLGDKILEGEAVAQSNGLDSTVVAVGYFHDKGGRYIMAINSFREQQKLPCPPEAPLWLSPDVSFYNVETIPNNVVLTYCHR